MTATTVSAWLAAATRRLRQAGVADAAREARLLLRWAADGSAETGDNNNGLSGAAFERAESGLARRERREPFSHITGQRDFWKHAFRVSAAVLDPRPDTETLLAIALEGPAPATIVDVGTGSGCILLSLLAEWQQATGMGIDISDAALDVARANARDLGLTDRTRWRVGAWLEPLTHPVDLIVANPPYLSAGELAKLQPELRHEPMIALDGGPDGLDAYRALAQQAPHRLVPGGRLLVEIGATQGEAVKALFSRSGLREVIIHPDINQRARVVSAKRPEIDHLTRFSG